MQFSVKNAHIDHVILAFQPQNQGGDGGSRHRAPLERGRRVLTAIFLFCLITKFCHVLWR